MPLSKRAKRKGRFDRMAERLCGLCGNYTPEPCGQCQKIRAALRRVDRAAANRGYDAGFEAGRNYHDRRVKP